jgi:hypothetical protein
LNKSKAIFFATCVVLSGIAPILLIFDSSSIDTPKLTVTILPHGEFIALLRVSFVAHPVRKTPDGLWLAMAPTNSNSVVVGVTENGVEVIPGGAGVETICQYLSV